MIGDAPRDAGIDTGAVYEHTRQRFVATVRALAPSALDAIVPATPEWSVHDVLAHVVGLATELNAARFPGDEGPDEWGRRLVALRRHTGLDELLGEWAREAPPFEDGLRLFGYETGSHFCADLHCHLQDVLDSLGLPPADDPLTVRVSLDHYLGFLHEKLGERAAGSVVVVADGVERTLGAGPVVATVRAGGFDLLRSFSARRSLGSIRGLHWTGDVDAALALVAEAYVVGYSFPPDQPA